MPNVTPGQPSPTLFLHRIIEAQDVFLSHVTAAHPIVIVESLISHCALRYFRYYRITRHLKDNLLKPVEGLVSLSEQKSALFVLLTATIKMEVYNCSQNNNDFFF